MSQAWLRSPLPMQFGSEETRADFERRMCEMHTRGCRLGYMFIVSPLQRVRTHTGRWLSEGQECRLEDFAGTKRAPRAVLLSLADEGRVIECVAPPRPPPAPLPPEAA